MKLRVLRALCLGGARQEPASTIDVADHIGRELIALGKAERVDAAASPVSGPMTTETAAGVVSGKTTPKARKGAEDAGQ